MWILRKSEIVRKSGSLPAANTLNGMSSCNRFWIRRELNTPVQYPYTNKLRHETRIVWRLPSLLFPVHRVNGRQVQLIHNVTHEVHQMLFRHPFAQARRQQQVLIGQIGSVALWHKALWPAFVLFVPSISRISRTGSE